jgi:signal transduction histidine kinase
MSSRRWIFSYVLVSLVTFLVALGAAALLLPSLFARPLDLWVFGGLLVGAAGLAALLGWLFTRRRLRRLKKAAAVSEAWLRGDLSPLIEDPAPDDFGRVARRLDQLTRQLSRDEQDLAELRAREARLTDQVRALSVVEERNRLARDLHDGVKQHLFSLSMTSSAIQDRLKSDPGCMPPELAEMFGQMGASAQAAQREMTQLIEGLRPASLQERGLALALNDYCLLFGAREHLLIYLEVQGEAALLPAYPAETLYIVAQEALANITRHARATRVDVRLNILPDLVTLSLRDNGAGFDRSLPHTGLGISNMQERLLALGGRLTVESQPGLGTLVSAEVGLARPLPDSPQVDRLDENRPLPHIENWAWLGQKLTIPVGQTWPWHPAEEASLQRPLIELDQAPLRLKVLPGFLGFGRGCQLQAGPTEAVLARLRRTASGSHWRLSGIRWSFKRVAGLAGKGVLYRNGQPLAAVQYQGRQMNMWSEFVYAGRGYRLGCSGPGGASSLTDEAGQELLQLSTDGSLVITLLCPLPLPLLNMVLLRYLEERGGRLGTSPEVPQERE